ncbi:MAG: hypothetical protein WD402_06650 [Chloroflexota bacterium]
MDLWPVLLLGSVLVGVALVLATTEIGSGDYGQWLMTARPYLGEAVPEYRAASAVPPVMPFLLGLTVRATGDPVLGVHLFAVLLLVALGLSAYAAGATFFGTRWAGLMALVGTLLLSDRFMELFAFGGLLQAGAIVLLWLGSAALLRAGRPGRWERAWWWAGSLCIGLAAVTHVGTATIIVPAGLVIGMLIAMRAAPTSQQRLIRLAPLGVALVIAGAYWLLFLLPGGTEFARNPASLTYRGPSRLLDALTAYWPGVLMAGLGLVGMIVGLVAELRRRAIGRWTVLAAWMAVTGLVVMAAVRTGAATDYPRFATPLLAPLVIAAAGAAVLVIHEAGGWLATVLRRGTTAGWSVSLAVALVVASVPPAVIAFGTQANGYRLVDPGSLVQAVAWIDGNVPNGATVVAPVREGKWIEGLSGHPALFSSAVRYSFRPEEWRRSLAADAVLRSGGALANEFFFARFTDGVAATGVPRTVVVGVNHGGEYLDLLKIAGEGTRLLEADGLTTLATLPNLAGEGRSVSADAVSASVTSSWTAERHGVPVTFHQIVAVRNGSSTLEIRASAATSTPTGFELELTPGQLALTGLGMIDRAAELTFAVAGSSAPRVRVVVSGLSATLEPLPDGGLRVRSAGGPIRLLITDLSGADSPTIGAQFLDPAQLISAYGVGAVLLVRDPAFEDRRIRLEALGFHVVQTFGPYIVMAPS